MRRLFEKFGFIHGRLWQRDGGYRVALLLGPAPVLGAILACALWGSIQGLQQITYQQPAWATPRPAPQAWGDDPNQPQTVQPARPLPPTSADGILMGHEAGWNVVAKPIQISPTMDVNVGQDSLSGLSMTGLSIDMDHILAEGPKDTLYVAVGTGFFVVREPGIYALSLHFERPPGPVANCVTRLGFGPHRIGSHLSLDVVGRVSPGFETAWFDLRPGLYPAGWAFGCWHDKEVIGPGRITIMVSHPGEKTLLPARPDDFVR
jgi:hypothetical protein